MTTTNYISLGESRVKSYRYSKALSESVQLLLRPVTLKLCISLGAERRLEFNRYSLLRLLAVLNQCIHCAGQPFGILAKLHAQLYWLYLSAPNCVMTYKGITCYSVLHRLTAELKWVDNNVCSRPLPAM